MLDDLARRYGGRPSAWLDADLESLTIDVMVLRAAQERTTALCQRKGASVTPTVAL